MESVKKTKPRLKKGSKFRRLCHNNRYVLLAFFASLMISCIFGISYKVFPFGNITVLRMDMFHQYGPMFAELYDKLTSGSSLVYSWESGGGGNFLGNFFNYLSSPVSLMVLIFGHKRVPLTLGFIIAFKAALTAAFFTYYLKKSRQFRWHSAVTAGFGLCYAFCGWFVAYYWNLMWIDGMMLLPFCVLGLEQLVDSKKPWIYVVSLTLLMISSYYMAYMVAIFLVLYFLVYTLSHYELGTPEVPIKLNKKGEATTLRTAYASKFLRGLVRCAVFAAVAGGLSAFALLPTYKALQNVSATSGVFPTSFRAYFTFFDFLANHMDSLEPTIRSSGDVVLPNVFCGIGTVLLVILFFYVKSVPLREKVAYAAFLAFMYASFNVNYLNYIWHGFHFPNDLPYRQSFVYVFMLLLMAAKALKYFREIRNQDLLTVGIVTCLFIVICEKVGSQNVDAVSVMTTIVFAVMYLIIFSLINSRKFRSAAISAILFCAMFAEMAAADVNHFDIDQDYDVNTADYDAVQTAKAMIADYDTDDDGLYRIERTHTVRCMDPCWYGYNGISEFSSMAYEMTSNLQYNLGMTSNYINSYMYNLQTPLYNAMFSLKYIINNDPSIPMNEDYFEEIGTADILTVYKNKYWLPVGFAADTDITKWNYYSSNPFKAQADFFTRASGVDDLYTNIPVDSFTYNNMEPFTEEIDSGSYTFSKINSEYEASFDATFTVPEDLNVYVYVRSADLTSLHFYTADTSIDRTQSIVDNSEFVYSLGKVEAGTIINMNADAENESGNVEIYIVGINNDNFEKAYTILDKGGMDVVKESETHLEGTVTIGKGEMLYTSINYDPGWTVTVDGKEVSSDKLVKIGGALLGVKMDAGSHKVTFRYHAPGLRLGVMVSAATLILVLLFAVVLPKLRKANKGDAGDDPDKNETEIEVNVSE